MESLAGRIPVARLLRTIRLFNQAAVDLKRGLQTIPQLPLELALVESMLGPEASEVATEPAQVAIEPAPKDEPSPPNAQPMRLADPPAPDPVPVAAEPAPESQPASGSLSLAGVNQAWKRVLQAVRQRNPAAEGALRSGCEPVEVDGDEIVVTFPYAFLRDKLGDPQRKMEIQEALSEVPGVV
jgi:hypothetical protein